MPHSITTYKTLTAGDIKIVTAEPLTGAAGQMLNDDLKVIADMFDSYTSAFSTQDFSTNHASVSTLLEVGNVSISGSGAINGQTLSLAPTDGAALTINPTFGATSLIDGGASNFAVSTTGDILCNSVTQNPDSTWYIQSDGTVACGSIGCGGITSNGLIGADAGFILTSDGSTWDTNGLNINGGTAVLNNLGYLTLNSDWSTNGAPPMDVGASLQATGDKIRLWGTWYGMGIQSGNFCLYTDHDNGAKISFNGTESDGSDDPTNGLIEYGYFDQNGLTVNGSVIASSFEGDGTNITGVQFGNMAGTLSDGQLSSNVVLKNANNVLTGTLTTSKTVTIHMPASGGGLVIDSSVAGSNTADLIAAPLNQSGEYFRVDRFGRTFISTLFFSTIANVVGGGQFSFNGDGYQGQWAGEQPRFRVQFNGSAAGFNTNLWLGCPTTTTQKKSFEIVNSLPVTTNASFTSRAVFNVYDATAAREAMRLETSGTAALIGFLGATAVAQQSIGSAATDAATTQTLANNIRTALINLGLCKT